MVLLQLERRIKKDKSKHGQPLLKWEASDENGIEEMYLTSSGDISN